MKKPITYDAFIRGCLFHGFTDDQADFLWDIFAEFKPDSPEEKKCIMHCGNGGLHVWGCALNEPEVSQEKEMFKGFDYFVPPYSKDDPYRKGEEAGRLAERKEIEKYLESQIKLMTDYPILSDARVLELRHALAAIRERK